MGGKGREDGPGGKSKSALGLGLISECRLYLGDSDGGRELGWSANSV